MSEREPTAAVFARYMTFQVPGMFVAALVLVGLVQWEYVTVAVALALFGFWVLKDLAMFPFLRVGYEKGGGPHGASALVGAAGTAQQELRDDEVGWVRVGPELWRARLEAGATPVAQGEKVRVVEVRDLTLQVVRADP